MLAEIDCSKTCLQGDLHTLTVAENGVMYRNVLDFTCHNGLVTRSHAHAPSPGCIINPNLELCCFLHKILQQGIQIFAALHGGCSVLQPALKITHLCLCATGLTDQHAILQSESRSAASAAHLPLIFVIFHVAGVFGNKTIFNSQAALMLGWMLTNAHSSCVLGASPCGSVAFQPQPSCTLQ